MTPSLATKSVVTTCRPWAAAALSRPFCLGIGGELGGEVLLGGAGLLLLEHGDDLGLHFSERAKVRGLLIFDLQDVVAELRLDHVGGLAGREREGGLVELRNGLAADRASRVRRPGSCCRGRRSTCGEVGEVAAGLDLLQQVFGLGLGGGFGLSVGAGGNGDQDMPYLDLRP